MLIIFDFDGVLFEAKWESLQRGYEAAIREEDKNPEDFFKTLPEFKKLWTPNWKENYRKFGLKNIGGDHHIFYEIADKMNSLFFWALEIISKLSKKHQLAIFTNRHSAKVRELAKPISRYFQCIIGGDDVRRLKPDPEGVYRIFSILEIKDNDALMIGDMPDDIMAGKTAGIKTGAVKWGLGDWDELMAYLPDYSFEEHEHLLQI